MLKSVMLSASGRERAFPGETQIGEHSERFEQTPSSRAKDDDKLKSELVPRVMEVCICVCMCVCV
jgi:hypothetical protein